jgi:hypothetical protein
LEEVMVVVEALVVALVEVAPVGLRVLRALGISKFLVSYEI